MTHQRNYSPFMCVTDLESFNISSDRTESLYSSLRGSRSLHSQKLLLLNLKVKHSNLVILSSNTKVHCDSNQQR